MGSMIQRSFASGELAPGLHARADMTKYTSGLHTCRNWMVKKSTGVTTRPGTKFIGEVKDSSKTIALIPFEFNSDQTYMLEFGDQYMRVIRNGDYQYDLTLTITGITNANPCVVTYTGIDPSNGQEFYINGITGAIGAFLNNRNFKIANVNAGANTFELQYLDGTSVNSTTFGAYTSGGSAQRVYTLTTPYAEAHLMRLQYVQSADVVTIVHPSYAPRELSRTDHTVWSLDVITFGPTVPAPTNVTLPALGSEDLYVVTSVSVNGEESYASTPVQSSAAASVGSPNELDWDDMNAIDPNVVSYNVYKYTGNAYGFIGNSDRTGFDDTGIDPDTTMRPPRASSFFQVAGDYPSAVTFVQQRLTFANTTNEPETVWCSRSGAYKNFDISEPIQDDDMIQFSMVGRQVNEVRHLVDIGSLVILTMGGEHTAEGNGNGVLTPADINPRQHSYNGSSYVRPLTVNSNVLYLQKSGRIVRDLGFVFDKNGYDGGDLTAFSDHLFEQYGIIDWTYQQYPNSIIWGVREDGILLGLTFVREHQIVGWHRHDTDGFVENVRVVQEGSEDVVYLVVRRIIDGETKRYIERLANRNVTDYKDYICQDGTLTYDGRNDDESHTMTLSGGTTWASTETINITSSTAYFTSAEVGNVIQLFITDEHGDVTDVIRFTLTGYTSSTVMQGTPHKTVPAGLRSVAVSDWTRAVDQITGLWHLEGKDVSIYADGYVVASPNNSDYGIVTVENGSITLDDCYGVIHIGLPFIADLKTLSLEVVNGETLIGKQKSVTKVAMQVEKTAGLFVGTAAPTDDDDDPLEGLYEVKISNIASNEEPAELETGVIEVPTQSQWNSNGQVFVRQVDPLPATVLSISPSGFIPVRS